MFVYGNKSIKDQNVNTSFLNYLFQTKEKIFCRLVDLALKCHNQLQLCLLKDVL